MHATTIDEQVSSLLARLETRPVLVDVGASAEVPPVWRLLARQSVYVGFDPDLREMRQENQTQFHHAYIMNQAVTCDASTDSVIFHLTRFPQCSSTLVPNRSVVDNYLFRERFDVYREVAVPATTLDTVINKLQLGGIDWLKLDTQGTDRRLIEGCSDGIRAGILAVDAEPGLRGAYHDEDLFGDLHAKMIRAGFYCAAAIVKGWPRANLTRLNALSQQASAAAGGDGWTAASTEAMAHVLPRCPCWVECRYLRTPESLGSGPNDRRAHILLWAFAMISNQPGFAGDVAAVYGSRFGQDSDWQTMASATTARISQLWAEHQANQCRQHGLIKAVRHRIGRLADGLGIGQPCRSLALALRVIPKRNVAAAARPNRYRSAGASG